MRAYWSDKKWRGKSDFFDRKKSLKKSTKMGAFWGQRPKKQPIL
jgi:hypothetical protein